MQRSFKITVDGRPYNVTVEDVSESPGSIIPSPGDMSAAMAAPPVAAAPAPAAAAAAPAAGPGDEVSPLAGVVVSIDVGMGQAVNAGDKVATIEAMKMKTIVTAQRAGKVTAIHAKAGDGVEPGQPLLTIG
ncbi:MAG: acetyl-CoA carboxylase biotin carboxyl carrier protein subunit [Rhodospirillaceae bacterium]|nr:acetyl-CoA carboxylase biotin carboxyl carrier protein subunit [Rhodospirillaceae bacterium]